MNILITLVSVSLAFGAVAWTQTVGPGWGEGCPCNPVSLCNPINDTNRKEVFAFVLQADNSTWLRFDWKKLTSIVLVGFYDEHLYCHAKANNVRVINIANYPASDLLDKRKRATWVLNQVKEAQAKFLDGLNIDFEDPVETGSNESLALTSLVQEVTNQLHAMIPGSQVTFDVPFAPLNVLGQGVDGRGYDFVALAKACDALFVMSYDQRSQVFTDGKPCIAQANSDYYLASWGVQGFLDLGIEANKLIFGQPWYGYKYECIPPSGNDPDGKHCFIKEQPWRGANCSDAVGKEIPYGEIIDQYLSHGGPLKQDPYSGTYYFNYHDVNGTHQFWFDRSSSYRAKYEMITSLGLRGVGMWTANFLNYSNSAMVDDMWATLPNYNKTSCIEM